MLRIMAALGWMLLCAGMAWAQNTGQVCMLVYLDANSNGGRDAGETLLNQGVGADLMDANGITIATRLLEDSPFAEDGIICFDALPAGEYGLRMTSAEYAATTSDAATASLGIGAPPPRVDIGVAPLFESVPAQASWTIDHDAAVELLIAAGAFLAAVALAGVAFALLMLTRPRRRAMRPAESANRP